MGEHNMSLLMLIKDCLLLKEIPSYRKEMLCFDLGDYAPPLVFSSKPLYIKD